jgi:hypothetical protein
METGAGNGTRDDGLVCTGVNLQKRVGEGRVFAKFCQVKLQKSAGNFAIMSTRLCELGKELWNELDKNFCKFFVKVHIDSFAPIFALHRLPDQHPSQLPIVYLWCHGCA